MASIQPRLRRSIVLSTTKQKWGKKEMAEGEQNFALKKELRCFNGKIV